MWFGAMETWAAAGLLSLARRKVVHGAVYVCDTVTWLGRVQDGLASLDHDAVSSRLRSLKWTAAGANSRMMSI